MFIRVKYNYYLCVTMSWILTTSLFCNGRPDSSRLIQITTCVSWCPGYCLLVSFGVDGQIHPDSSRLLHVCHDVLDIDYQSLLQWKARFIQTHPNYYLCVMMSWILTTSLFCNGRPDSSRFIQIITCVSGFPGYWLPVSFGMEGQIHTDPNLMICQVDTLFIFEKFQKFILTS